jgi:ribonuclease HI
MNTNEITIFVYATCSMTEFLGNHRVGNGGYAFSIFEDGKKVEERAYTFSKTNNYRMNLQGMINALQSSRNTKKIKIYNNFEIIINAYNKNWIENWREQGLEFRENGDLWIELDEIINKMEFPVEFIWMRTSDNHCLPEMKRASDILEQKRREGKFILDKVNFNKLNGSHKNEEDTQNDLTITIIDRKTYDNNSICVHAECEGPIGKIKYFGFDIKSKKIIFKSINFEIGSKNAGEFLAIVHALAQMKKENTEQRIIYSVSDIAIGWVRDKTQRTDLFKDKKTEAFFEMLDRAIKWLENNEYEMDKILKWETNMWGKNPARKAAKNQVGK